MISAKLQNTTDVDEPEELWMDIKSSILEAAEDTCGKQVAYQRNVRVCVCMGHVA